MEGLWGLITVVGPLVLIGVLLFGYLKNRQQPRSEVQRSEKGARDLRAEIDREDRDAS